MTSYDRLLSLIKRAESSGLFHYSPNRLYISHVDGKITENSADKIIFLPAFLKGLFGDEYRIVAHRLLDVKLENKDTLGTLYTWVFESKESYATAPQDNEETSEIIS